MVTFDWVAGGECHPWSGATVGPVSVCGSPVSSHSQPAYTTQRASTRMSAVRRSPWATSRCEVIKLPANGPEHVVRAVRGIVRADDC
jgi:hypothetical protein